MFILYKICVKMFKVDILYIHYFWEEKFMNKNTACFIGHRKINETEDLKIRLWDLIEDLILNQNVTTFLFGSKSAFNSLCEKTLIKAKET